MNETIRFWLRESPKKYKKHTFEEMTSDDIRSEIEKVKGTVSNERIWEKGYLPSQNQDIDECEYFNPHTENIAELEKYAYILNERLAELNKN